jgi:hypothetical protein
MRQSIAFAVLALMVACIPLGAATMPTIIVTNKSDSMIQITPIDDAHKPPAPLDQVSAALPPGSFILTNQTPTQINAVVVLWAYTDTNGTTLQKRFNWDGYINGSIPSVIVRPSDSTLITPGGCTMREYFAHMATGKPMLGGGLLLSRNKSVLDIAGTLTDVRITLDSIIFADGRIWGPDTKQYYKSVSARYWAIRSVVEEVATAKAAGQDISIPAEKIRAETEGKGDEPSRLRNSYANSIRHSPNPEGTLKAFSQQPPLPEFQHLGGETK